MARTLPPGQTVDYERLNEFLDAIREQNRAGRQQVGRGFVKGAAAGVAWYVYKNARQRGRP